ncbi:hypothetical protein L210DRAFT_863772, partial [Boletus edulis BED1]
DEKPSAWKEKYGKPELGCCSNCNFYYSPNTTTTMLHKHLDVWHLLAYVILAQERSWTPQLLAVAHAMDRGYTLADLETLIHDGSSIMNLPLQVTGDSNMIDTNLTGQAMIPLYTKEVFIDILTHSLLLVT